MYNFCEFSEVNNLTQLLSNGDIISDTAWTKDDVSPIGTNDDDWVYSSGVYITNVFGDFYTKGLSQEVNLKKGNNYFFSISVSESSGSDVEFWLLAIYGSSYDIIFYDTINNVTNKYYTSVVNASQNYDKIMVVGNNVAASPTFAISVSNVHVYDVDGVDNFSCNYALPLVKNDVVQAYTNFDIDDTEYAFSNLKLGLYSDGFYLYDIATLNQAVVSGDIYNVYFSWTVPQLPKGNYRFVLYEDTNNIHYISNSFRYTSNKEHTKILKYRNTIDTLGYLYETATTFYNQFRIDIYRGKPSFPNNSTGYQTYTGDFIRVKSDIQKTVEFVMGFASETILEAFISALLHDEVYLNDVKYKKPDGENLAINFSDEDLKIGTGTVNLLEVSYSKSIESC